MRSSILIALLVVVISSSTYGDGDLFGVEIDPHKLFTLGKEEVDTEVDAKTQLLKEIDTFEQSDEKAKRGWTAEFKKLVSAERDIIGKLYVSLSHLNTDVMKNINNDDLKKQISENDYTQLADEVQKYVTMLGNLDFSPIVWEVRSFLGNQFEEFLGKVTESIPDDKTAKKLKSAFSKAAKEVGNAKSAILGIMADFKWSIDAQKKQSQVVMTELRVLNNYAVSLTVKKVKQSVAELIFKLNRLRKDMENVNKLTHPKYLGTKKRAWIDEIRKELIKIDKAHEKLNPKLADV